MVIPPSEPNPAPNPDPGPVPPMPAPPRPPDIPEPTPQPTEPGQNPDLPPAREPFPEPAPPPSATGMEEVETDLALAVLAPLYQDLSDWRAEVQKLFDRTKAAREARIVDMSAFEAVEIAKEGLDMQLDAFDDVVSELGAEQSVVAGPLGELGDAFQKLRLATEMIGEVLETMTHEGGAPGPN